MVRKLLNRNPKASDDSRRPDFRETLGGYELPTFPALVAQALSHLGNPESDMASVAAIVERDPGASARVLRLVNSASFSPRSSVTSIHQAAMMLGRNQLEALLISVGARGALPDPSCASFERTRFWATASKRASLASLIAERTDPTRRSENFTAALLQDMAIPVLALRADLYGDVLDQWHHSAEDLAAIESHSYGWHHGMVAGWMGETWNFPADFVEFMATHHSDDGGQGLLPARLVASVREADTQGDERVVEVGREAVDLGFDELRAMIVQAEEESAHLAKLLG